MNMVFCYYFIFWAALPPTIYLLINKWAPIPQYIQYHVFLLNNINLHSYIFMNKENKIEDIIKMCEAAISKQTLKNKKGGFGYDDYTDGRIIGGASLARNILKLIKS